MTVNELPESVRVEVAAYMARNPDTKLHGFTVWPPVVDSVADLDSIFAILPKAHIGVQMRIRGYVVALSEPSEWMQSKTHKGGITRNVRYGKEAA